MPAKRRPSKFVKQAPQVNKPQIDDTESFANSLLTNNAEKLGLSLIKMSKSGKIDKISKLLSHADVASFINHRDQVSALIDFCPCDLISTNSMDGMLLCAQAKLECWMYAPCCSTLEQTRMRAIT